MDDKSAQLNIQKCEKHYFSFVKFWNRNLEKIQVVSLPLSKRRFEWCNDATARKRPVLHARVLTRTMHPSLGENLHHPVRSVLTARGGRVLTLTTVSKGFESWSLKGSTQENGENYTTWSLIFCPLNLILLGR